MTDDRQTMMYNRRAMADNRQTLADDKTNLICHTKQSCGNFPQNKINTEHIGFDDWLT